MIDAKLFRDVQHTINKSYAYVSAVKEYSNWDDRFSREEVVKHLTNMQKTVKKLIDLNDLSKYQLTALGFSPWSESSPVMLVPLHLFPVLRDGTKLTCIDGEEFVVGKDEIDNDIRFGCIAYGITCKE